MEDPSHLEKMGRELKCPICLSLLNSAVSLTCNHVFCNACILKSMKSVSNCPVCKVPYRRREVRAAPHMDNLVSIYKSMEVASGVNIFVTQNAPLTKSSDEEKQVEGDPNCGQDIGRICQDRTENQGMSKRKESRKKAISAKPSFPAKKRVQVPLYPLSETPTCPAKFDGASVENTEDEFKSSSVVSKENPVPNEKGQLVLSPFFWLRDEEDAEKLSQHTNGDQIVDITPPNVPSFSDIKDSDDECPSPTAEVNGKSNVEDFFDSEMFEWTQRACSPELLSTPVQTQVEDTEEIQERKLEEVLQGTNTDEEPSTENAKCMNIKQGTGIADDSPSNVSSPRTKNSNCQIGTGKSKKRGRKAKEISLKKCAKRNADEFSEIQVDSKTEFENFAQRQTSKNNGYSLNLETRKINKKVGFGGETNPTSENPLFSVRAETLNQGDRSMVNIPASLGNKQGGDEDLNLEKTQKNHRIINALNQRDYVLRSKKRKLDSLKINVLEEVSTIQNQTNENLIPQVSLLSVPVDDHNNASNFKDITSKDGKEINSVLSFKCNQETRSKKKMKVSFNGISKDGLVYENQESNGNVSAKKTQPTKKVQGSPDVRVLYGPSTVDKLSMRNGVTLRKCNALPHKFQCAFCLSSEDSEASGEMVHYYNGRPVASDYKDTSKVIHSHRGCTEWAPNVYFEDDTAINLEAELARSRRIKCCCCDLRGAALGCYEKSCRKSFHVPCAKSTPQCRWDTDNFVMLCPLHASSKLPNENSESQERRRKKCMPKEQMLTKCNQVVKPNTSTSWHWKSCGPLNKLVLCCSALTVGEREIVTEFERLSGILVLKNWDSRVTHVIASTDENKACRRTLKVLMGILEGKWILNIEWVKACMQAMEPVDEEQYEITVDIHGNRDGPRLGRLRLQNKQPKLFDGLKFYLMGDFIPSYKGYLQDLVIAAGGTVLQRKPISRDQGAVTSGSCTFSTFIIYSLEVPDKCDPSKKNVIFNRRRSDAEALASSSGAKAVSNSWVLNSIAACQLQSFVE